MSQSLMGLIQQMLKETPLADVKVQPKLEQKDIVITLNEEQFRNLALGKVDPKVRNTISIKIHEGYIEVRIKLF